MLIILACRIHGQQKVETFLEGWDVLLNRVVNNGKLLNWSYLLAQQLRIHVGNSLNPPKGGNTIFYMSKYLLDVIFAHNTFPSMNQAWSPYEIFVHIHCKILLYYNHRGVMEKLTDHFLILLYKIIFEEEPHCMSPVKMEEISEIECWFSSPDGTLLRVFSGRCFRMFFPGYATKNLVM